MMRAVLAMVVLAPAARAEDTSKTKTAKTAQTQPKGEKTKGAVFISNDTAQWGPAPPDLPKGAQLAVLYGDPTKAGEYAMRLKVPDGYKVPQHWHTKDEQLTIISGTFVFHMGGTMEGEAHTMKAGDYHFLPAKMHHAAETKGETIVQVSGQGPWDIHYVNPADNPNPKSAKR
jgi:quercetin dioxygenase-like cupin family protein